MKTKFNKNHIKGFLCGVCASALLFGATAAMAVNIDVYMGGIKVFWDGVEKRLHDGNGNTVEPLIYNGTTYVPLRAMSNLMGKEVGWNQQEMSVYVGQQPIAKTTPLEDLPPEKIQGWMRVEQGKDAYYQFKDKKINCSNIIQGRGSDRKCTIILDNQYSRFIGKDVYPFDSIGDNREGTITFYNLSDNGDKTEIISYDITQTEAPIDIDVNLKGVVNLEIEYSKDNSNLCIFDASLLSE